MTKESKFRKASEVAPMEILPTGISALDFASGVGGFVAGTQVEIFGRASVGKSLLACYIVAEAQRRNHECAYIDLEGTFSPKWVEKTSKVDLGKLNLADAASGLTPGLDSLKALEEAIKAGNKLIIFDAIGAMVDDSEKDITAMRVGGTSKIVTHMVTRLQPLITEKKCVVVYINHSKDDMGFTPNPGHVSEKAPGGRTKENMCFMRINLQAGKVLTDGKNNNIGFRVTANFKKNKAGVPRKKVGWNLWNIPEPKHGTVGIDLIQDIIDTSINQGIIGKSGSWFTHDLFGTKLQGEDKVAAFLTEHPEGIDILHKEVLELTRQIYIENNYGKL